MNELVVVVHIAFREYFDTRPSVLRHPVVFDVGREARQRDFLRIERGAQLVEPALLERFSIRAGKTDAPRATTASSAFESRAAA